jgi:NTE family protein
MASATFPGVFNFMTLTNHCAKNDYAHLFDGGNSNNLGLTSLKRELRNLGDAAVKPDGKKLSDYRNIIVILIDAYTDSNGVNESAKEPCKWYDYLVDTNFITATGSLLAKNRISLPLTCSCARCESISSGNRSRRTSFPSALRTWSVPNYGSA